MKLGICIFLKSVLVVKYFEGDVGRNLIWRSIQFLLFSIWKIVIHVKLGHQFSVSGKIETKQSKPNTILLIQLFKHILYESFDYYNCV